MRLRLRVGDDTAERPLPLATTNVAPGRPERSHEAIVASHGVSPVRGPLLAGCLQVAGAGEPSPANGIQAPGPSSFALLEPPRVGRAPVAGVDSDSESPAELRLELQPSTHQPINPRCGSATGARGCGAPLRCPAVLGGTRQYSARLRSVGARRERRVRDRLRKRRKLGGWAELGLPHALD
jgi:hypothetical protein